jgi:hypothetical protein
MSIPPSSVIVPSKEIPAGVLAIQPDGQAVYLKIENQINTQKDQLNNLVQTDANRLADYETIPSYDAPNTARDSTLKNTIMTVDDVMRMACEAAAGACTGTASDWLKHLEEADAQLQRSLSQDDHGVRNVS